MYISDPYWVQNCHTYNLLFKANRLCLSDARQTSGEHCEVFTVSVFLLTHSYN